MPLFGRLRRLIGDGDVVYECRDCGTSLAPERDDCRNCGSDDVVRYDIE